MQYLQSIFNKKKKKRKNIDRIRLIQFPFLYIVKKKSAFQSILKSLFMAGGNTFWRLVRNIQLQIKNKLLCRNLHFKTSPCRRGRKRGEEDGTLRWTFRPLLNTGRGNTLIDGEKEGGREKSTSQSN